MVGSFGPIVLAAAIATAFGLFPLIIANLLIPKHPDSVKNAPYECGVETIGPATMQFPTKFYIYGLMFVLFDVEAVFFFPWAVSSGQLGIYGLVEMAVFVGLLLVGYVYAWRTRALDWV